MSITYHLYVILGIIKIALLSYLIGSIPFGYIISKWKGVDITKVGSGNIGMANVYRTLGPAYGIAVLILDALKGFSAALLSQKLTTWCAVIPIDPSLAAVIGGAFAIVGHNWSIFLNFRGGKGIATSAGVLAYISPYVLVIGFSAWFLITAVTGYSALGSITGALIALTLGVLSLLRVGKVSHLFFQQDYYAWFVIIASLIAIYRHKSNIKRLMEGRENKLYLFGKPKGINEGEAEEG